MHKVKQNYYGNLCTEMYEILHAQAPEDELAFYLSYAQKKDNILEALCGSGRFLVPFMQQGYHISGIDLSNEMLDKLKQKMPNAKVFQADILDYCSDEQYDYIFISSGSISLFTDVDLCIQILKKLKGMLAPHGKLVFAVETIADQCIDDEDYKTVESVKTKDGLNLILKCQNYYDKQSRTQFSPGIYELYNDDAVLLQREEMDFQTHLYQPGEMEQYLKEIGFKNIKTYSSFSKELSPPQSERFLFECHID